MTVRRKQPPAAATPSQDGGYHDHNNLNDISNSNSHNNSNPLNFSHSHSSHSPSYPVSRPHPDSHSRSRSYPHSQVPPPQVDPHAPNPHHGQPVSMELLQRITYGLLGRRSVDTSTHDEYALAPTTQTHTSISSPSPLEPTPKAVPAAPVPADKDTFGRSASGGLPASLKRIRQKASNSISSASFMTEAQAEVVAYNNNHNHKSCGSGAGLGSGPKSKSKSPPASQSRSQSRSQSHPKSAITYTNNNNNTVRSTTSDFVSSNCNYHTNNNTIRSRAGDAFAPSTPATVSPAKSFFSELGGSAMPPDRMRTPAGPVSAAAAASPYASAGGSVKAQRSFLRSITNHTSLSAIRNRTWKRKDIPTVSSLETEVEGGEGEGSSSGHGHGHSHGSVRDHAHTNSIRGFTFGTLKSKAKAKQETKETTTIGSNTTPTRPRLRRSVKRSLSIPGLDAVPPLPSPPVIDCNRDSVETISVMESVSTKGHSSLLRKALQPNPPQAHCRPAVDSVPSTSSSIASLAPVLPPLPPATHFLRRVGNKVPTEVGLEFGTTPSPQSDRILRSRPTHFDPTHRRHKSESANGSITNCGQNSLARPSGSPSANNLPPLPEASIEYTPSDFETPPNAYASLSPSADVTPTPAAPGADETTEESLVSIGSFDINVLDRSLGTEQQETLASNSPAQSYMSMATTTTDTPTKHTRHRDVFGRTGASTPSSSVTSAAPVVTGAYLSVHSAESTESTDSPLVVPSIAGHPAPIFQLATGNESSFIESDVGTELDTEVIPFRTDASRGSVSGFGLGRLRGLSGLGRNAQAAPIGLGLIDIEVGADFGNDTDDDASSILSSSTGSIRVRFLNNARDANHMGLLIEELRDDDTPPDSGVSSPLDTDINTPTEEVRPGALSAEHERQWAAFANLPDDESSQSIHSNIKNTSSSTTEDFQPVNEDDEEHFLSFRGAESSLNYDDRRFSTASSDDSFGAPHPWVCRSLSTIAEVSYSSNALSLMSMRPDATTSSASGSIPPGRRSGILEAVPEQNIPAQQDTAPLEPTCATDILEVFDTELRASKDENLALRDRIQELEFSLAQARSAMAANEASVDTLQTSHKVLQNECEILRAGVEHAEFENKALAAVFCEAKDKHAIELSTLEQALHKRIDQLSDCEQELAVSRLELNTKDAEGEQLMTELEMAKFAVDESRVMHATTRRENESLRQEDESLRQDNEALSSALADAITEQENVWKTAQFFKEELEEQASKFVHERAAWSTWENERNEYDKRTTMLQKELEISDRKLNIEETRVYRAEVVTIPRLQERIASLTTLLRDATSPEPIDDEDADMSNTSIRSLDTSINTVIDQETDLIALRRAVDVKTIELNEVTRHFERHKRSCIRDIGDMREDATSLKEEVKTLKTELRSLRESEEVHRGRAADYFQRNKSCLAELDRLNLIASQRMSELNALRAKANNASIAETGLEKRITQLEDERDMLNEALKLKDFELSMVKRQVPASPTPQRNMKRSTSRATNHGHSVSFSHSPSLRSPAPPAPSRLKHKSAAEAEDSPSPNARKLRPKRALTLTSGSASTSASVSPLPSPNEKPTKAFPGELTITLDASEEGNALTPTTKHNTNASEPTPGTSALAPTDKSAKKRTQSTPHSRPVSVLLARSSGIPVPKPSRKEYVVTAFATS